MQTGFGIHQDAHIKHSVHKLAEQQRQQQLAKILAANCTTAIVMTAPEFIEFCLAYKRKQGLSPQQTEQWYSNVISQQTNIQPEHQQLWLDHSNAIGKTGAVAQLAADMKAIGALAIDLNKGGSVFTQYRVSHANGKAYIIFKGNARLRETLKGTRYLASNPKVLSLALTQSGVKNTLTKGFIFSLVFSVGFNGLDVVMNDEKTWHNFVAGVTVDMAVTITSAGLTWGAVTVLGAFFGGLAIGPVLIVGIVGFALALGLGHVAQNSQLADKLADKLLKAEDYVRSQIPELANHPSRGNAQRDPVSLLSRMFSIPCVRLN